MFSENVQRWNEIFDRMMLNRVRDMFVRDEALEAMYTKELERLFVLLTPEERAIVPRPRPPRRMSLIAHNEEGKLIGFEDND